MSDLKNGIIKAMEMKEEIAERDKRIAELKTILKQVMDDANELLVELNDVPVPLGAQIMIDRLDQTLQIADQQEKPE